MKIESYFRGVSYATVLAGAAALFLSGGFGLGLAAGFVGVVIVAWKMEGSRWQLPERAALVVVIISVPLFYIDWKLQVSVGNEGEKVGVTALTHLILFLSIVKLVQVKADRDWIFLFLISFFEVLLAAGLSISPAFLATLIIYLLCILGTIIAFEMRKAGRVVKHAETRLLVSPESRTLRKRLLRPERRTPAEIRRLPLVTVGLLAGIGILAIPLFFVAPRYGGSAFARSSGFAVGQVGFSDSVSLGQTGKLQQSDQVVMRVKVEGADAGSAAELRWRGVALDHFTGRGWIRTKLGETRFMESNDRNFFRLGTTEALPKLVAQSFFVEPLGTNVVFAAPRVVAVQGPLPFLRQDAEGNLTTASHELARISYKVYSDVTTPDPSLLRRDLQPYGDEARPFLDLPPDLDPKIGALARDLVARAGAVNRYDIARAFERYFKDPANFTYSLDLKASGDEPLSDFLFRVKSGHCEYFAAAMAVMLRTQRVAVRVVNGFRAGTYNDAGDFFSVSQKEAHSWVEVYFPQTGSWVSFDPTPASGETSGNATGFSARIGKYAEALQMIWTEYFVSYDRQEQRTLASSIRNRFSDPGRSLSEWAHRWATSIGQFFAGAPSDKKSAMGVFWRVAGALVVAALIAWLIFRLRRRGFGRTFAGRKSSSRPEHVIEFYDAMIRLLEARGYVRSKDQTPLEFARTVGRSEALLLTSAYNNVRYGARALSFSESRQIREWLASLGSDALKP